MSWTTPVLLDSLSRSSAQPWALLKPNGSFICSILLNLAALNWVDLLRRYICWTPDVQWNGIQVCNNSLQNYAAIFKRTIMWVLGELMR